MSHQVEVSGIYQFDTGSHLVSVLGLRQLMKVLEYIKCSCHPPDACRLLWWGRVSVSCHGGASSIYQAQTDQDLVMWIKGFASF